MTDWKGRSQGQKKKLQAWVYPLLQHAPSHCSKVHLEETCHTQGPVHLWIGTWYHQLGFLLTGMNCWPAMEQIVRKTVAPASLLPAHHFILFTREIDLWGGPSALHDVERPGARTLLNLSQITAEALSATVPSRVNVARSNMSASCFSLNESRLVFVLKDINTLWNNVNLLQTRLGVSVWDNEVASVCSTITLLLLFLASVGRSIASCPHWTFGGMAQTPDGMDKTLLDQTQSQPVYSTPPGLPKEPVN